MESVSDRERGCDVSSLLVRESRSQIEEIDLRFCENCELNENLQNFDLAKTGCQNLRATFARKEVMSAGRGVVVERER